MPKDNGNWNAIHPYSCKCDKRGSLHLRNRINPDVPRINGRPPLPPAPGPAPSNCHYRAFWLQDEHDWLVELVFDEGRERVKRPHQLPSGIWVFAAPNGLEVLAAFGDAHLRSLLGIMYSTYERRSFPGNLVKLGKPARYSGRMFYDALTAFDTAPDWAGFGDFFDSMRVPVEMEAA